MAVTGYLAHILGLSHRICGMSESTTTAGVNVWPTSGLWLVQAFPFDVTHVADVVPTEFQFLLAWMSDGVRTILLLQVVVGLFAALFTLVTYVMVTATLYSRRG
jgi:hypothetical protein